MKKVLFIFGAAFFANAIWENLHVHLYDNYMGGKISEFILLRATFWDAVIILVITLPFVFCPRMKKFSWLIFILGVFISILIEIFALNTGRWAYNSLMPIIPILKLGLTPVFQLGLLGYIIYKWEENLASTHKL